jgi:hypothetical protein
LRLRHFTSILGPILHHKPLTIHWKSAVGSTNN